MVPCAGEIGRQAGRLEGAGSSFRRRTKSGLRDSWHSLERADLVLLVPRACAGAGRDAEGGASCQDLRGCLS